jgi:hypothetical protein
MNWIIGFGRRIRSVIAAKNCKVKSVGTTADRAGCDCGGNCEVNEIKVPARDLINFLIDRRELTIIPETGGLRPSQRIYYCQLPETTTIYVRIAIGVLKPRPGSTPESWTTACMTSRQMALTRLSDAQLLQGLLANRELISVADPDKEASVLLAPLNDTLDNLSIPRLISLNSNSVQIQPEAAQHRLPTEKMLALARSTARKKMIDLPVAIASDFDVCRAFLNENGVPLIKARR